MWQGGNENTQKLNTWLIMSAIFFSILKNFVDKEQFTFFGRSILRESESSGKKQK